MSSVTHVWRILAHHSCNHEEADTRNNGLSRSWFGQLTLTSSWCVCGTGISASTRTDFGFWSWKESAVSAASLRADRASALQIFHDGCDTVSSFAEHGKKSAWTIQDVLPEVSSTLLKLSVAQDHTPNEVVKNHREAR